MKRYVVVYKDLVDNVACSLPVEADSKVEAEEKFMKQCFPMLYNLGYISLEGAFGDLSNAEKAIEIYDASEEDYICEE